MRGDEKRQSLRGELMNFFPKIAARFWIDTGSRFVEQQQFRPMNQTSCERKTLLPTARKMASKLFLSFREAEFFDALTHGLHAIFHAVHSRDEIKIFFNAQVLPKTESLGHVTDFALDRFAFGNHIVTEHLAASVIGEEQSAKHSQECRLAAAVRSEESVNLAGAHRKIDMIDRGKFAETFRHSVDLDDVLAVFHLDLNSTSTG